MKWWDQMPWSSFSEYWALSQLFHSPLSLSSVTIDSLDILLFLFGTSLLSHVHFQTLLPDLHTGFSRGRSGGLVFPSLSEFSTVYCDHTVKGFGIVNKAEVDDFWNLLAFSMIQRMLAIWSLVPLPFLKPAWTSGSSWFTYCWSLAWKTLSIILLACEMSAIVW